MPFGGSSGSVSSAPTEIAKLVPVAMATRLPPSNGSPCQIETVVWPISDIVPFTSTSVKSTPVTSQVWPVGTLKLSKTVQLRAAPLPQRFGPSPRNHAEKTD
jgi:hypothetical protein